MPLRTETHWIWVKSSIECGPATPQPQSRTPHTGICGPSRTGLAQRSPHPIRTAEESCRTTEFTSEQVSRRRHLGTRYSPRAGRRGWSRSREFRLASALGIRRRRSSAAAEITLTRDDCCVAEAVASGLPRGQAEAIVDEMPGFRARRVRRRRACMCARWSKAVPAAASGRMGYGPGRLGAGCSQRSGVD